MLTVTRNLQNIYNIKREYFYSNFEINNFRIIVIDTYIIIRSL